MIDVFGSCSKGLKCSMLKMPGRREKKVLTNMKKAIITNSLNIVRTLKIVIIVVLEANSPIFITYLHA